MDVPVSPDWARETFKRMLKFYGFVYNETLLHMSDGPVFFITGWEQGTNLAPEDDWKDEFGDGYLKVSFEKSCAWFLTGNISTFFMGGEEINYHQGPYGFMVELMDRLRYFFMPLMDRHLPRLSHKWLMAELNERSRRP